MADGVRWDYWSWLWVELAAGIGEFGRLCDEIQYLGTSLLEVDVTRMMRIYIKHAFRASTQDVM